MRDERNGWSRKISGSPLEIRQEQNLVGEGARMKEIFQFLARVGPDRFDGVD